MSLPTAAYAEGAGLFLIEEKEAALARGARILAEIAGYGSHLILTRTCPEAGGPVRSRRPQECRLEPAMIDSISAWGPGIQSSTASKRKRSFKCSAAKRRTFRFIPSKERLETLGCRRTTAGGGGDFFLPRWSGATHRESGCPYPRSARLRPRKCPVFFSRDSLAECAWHRRGECHSSLKAPATGLARSS